MSKAISKKIYSQHVADKNGEIIEVIVHCASNIPTIKGKIPHVFITGYILYYISIIRGDQLFRLDQGNIMK